MIRRPEVIAGVRLDPVAERALGGAVVKLTADGAELDRDDVEQLLQALDEARER